MITFKVKLLPGGQVPTKGSAFAAGWDIRAVGNYEIRQNTTVMIHCGFQMEMPEDCAAFIQPRSGLAAKHSVTIANTPGLIDSDYRGEVCVLLRNEGTQSFVVSNGDRIAQMVVKRLEPSELEIVEELDTTDRGENGFGSTGSK